MTIHSSSKRSEVRTHHPALTRLLSRVSQRIRFTLVGGSQSEFDGSQRDAEWSSCLLHAKSIRYPCMEVDLIPCSDDGNSAPDERTFLLFACVVFECAAEMGVRVRWGGNSHVLRSMLHWELMTDHD